LSKKIVRGASAPLPTLIDRVKLFNRINQSARRANHFVFSEMTSPAPFAKIFCFAPEANQFTDLRRPVPEEGRLAIVTNAGRDAMDVAARETNAACSRTAKSCGSGAPMLASSLVEFSAGRRCQTSLVTGESTKETVKPLRGECRLIRLNLW
jgi:hypothetical protein